MRAGTSEKAQRQSSGSYRVLLVGLLCLNFGILFFDRNALNFLMPYVQPELHLTYTQVGLLGSALSSAVRIFEARLGLASHPWLADHRIYDHTLFPATGFLELTQAAAVQVLGEYGSVIFLAGNMPYRSEIAPLLIITKLEQYDYAGAASVGLAMLAISLAALLLINAVQLRAAQRGMAA